MTLLERDCYLLTRVRVTFLHVVFTLYTSDLQYNSESCHVQKFADDTAIVGFVRNGQEDENRKLIQDFVE